jgi:molybdopterin-guanine dinucleotide biosynthesis protein A
MGSIIGVILAGGRSSRMGRDKVLVTLGDRTLIALVIERLAPQVDQLAISANEEPGRFVELGLPVIPDAIPGLAGPLAGVHSAALRFPEAELVSVAVDLPFLPRDLVKRLRAGIGVAECGFASTRGQHAAAIFWRAGQADALAQFLARGGRRVESWLGTHGVAVEFPATADEDVLFNINTPADLASAAQRLRLAEEAARLSARGT